MATAATEAGNPVPWFLDPDNTIHSDYLDGLFGSCLAIKHIADKSREVGHFYVTSFSKSPNDFACFLINLPYFL